MKGRPTETKEDMISMLYDLMLSGGWVPKDAPDRILQKKFNDYRGVAKWELIANANKEPRKVVPDQWGEMELGPFQIAVFWNGWLAGILNPWGGEFAANQEGANQEAFLKSVAAATASSEAP